MRLYAVEWFSCLLPGHSLCHGLSLLWQHFWTAPFQLPEVCKCCLVVIQTSPKCWLGWGWQAGVDHRKLIVNWWWTGSTDRGFLFSNLSYLLHCESLSPPSGGVLSWPYRPNDQTSNTWTSVQNEGSVLCRVYFLSWLVWNNIAIMFAIWCPGLSQPVVPWLSNQNKEYI